MTPRPGGNFRSLPLPNICRLRGLRPGNPATRLLTLLLHRQTHSSRREILRGKQWCIVLRTLTRSRDTRKIVQKL